MKHFDYKYVESIEDLKRFANSNDVTIVSILPYNVWHWQYLACYYINEQSKDSL